MNRKPLEERIRNYDQNIVDIAEGIYNSLNPEDKKKVYDESARILDRSTTCKKFEIDYSQGHLGKQILITMTKLGYLNEETANFKHYNIIK